MDLKEKILTAFRRTLQPEYVHLDDDKGISGFVVSGTFFGMPALDRQTRIEEILKESPLGLEERRQILMIAGLTPEEYDAVGARIRIEKVKEADGGAVEIQLHGGRSDADYVRKALKGQKGIQTTDPMPVNGAIGVLMSFQAKGTKANPLTKERTIRMLKKDQYIEVLTNA